MNMAKLLLITFLLTISLLSGAQTVKIVSTNAGELSSKLTSAEKKTITGLTVTGTINEQDFNTIRDSLRALTDLDLSGSVVQPTIIPEKAFQNCSRLVSVALPASATYLGSYAFEYCVNLEKVIFPVTLKSIGSYAFDKCLSLKVIEIPPSVTRFDKCIFWGCVSLTSVKLPIGLKSLGGYCFRGCINLKDVNIPDSLIAFETDDFYGCASIGKIRIPASTKIIRADAFGNSDYIFEVDPENKLFSSMDGVLYNKDQTILYKCPESFSGIFNIPASVKKIDGGAFSECKNLTSVNFPDELEEIMSNAFTGCTELTEIEIPSKVDSLSNQIFRGCTKLRSIKIPDIVTYIGMRAFYNCRVLDSFNFPALLTEIGESAFEQVPFDTVFISASVQKIDDFAFRSCPCYFNVDEANGKYVSMDGVLFDKDISKLLQGPPSLEGEYAVPPTVKMIFNYSFVNCNKLTSVQLPASVTVVGQNAFLSLPCRIIVDSENQKFASLDGVLFSKDMTRLIFCPTSKTGYYYIPDGVKDIFNSAFFNCKKLTSIHIPATLYSLYADDFINCTAQITGIEDHKSLKEVDGVIYSSSMEILYFCQRSFSGSLIIPSTVETIDYYAFANCKYLTEITIPESVVKINNCAFYDCPGLKKMHLLDPEPHNVYYSNKEEHFYNVDKKGCELFIPAGSMIFYKNTEPWKDFFNFTEYELNVNSDSIRIGFDNTYTAEIEVLSNIGWNLSINSDWLISDVKSGEGNGIITLTSTATADTIKRTSTLQLYGTGVDTLTIIIVQEPLKEPESYNQLVESIDLIIDNSTSTLFLIGEIEEGSIILSDISGKIIFKGKIFRGESFDFSYLLPGIYIANIKTSKGTIQKKIVRESK